MSLHSRVADPPLSLAQARQVEDACLRFEAAWQAAAAPEQRPRIENFVSTVPEVAQRALVAELVALEMELRRQAGEQPEPADYRDRFPALNPAWLADAVTRGSRAAPSAVPSLNETSTVAPAPARQRVDLTPMAGAGPGPAGDIQPLLRKRLRFISLVVAAIYGYFVIAVAANFLRDFDTNLQTLIDYWVYMPPTVLAMFMVGFVVIVLWKKRPLSLRQLRWIELTLFGAVLIAEASELGFDLFGSPQIPGAKSWQRTIDEDIVLWHFHSAYASLVFVFLIISYATFIPSGWQRCTLVVGMMALIPVGISAVAALTSVAHPTTFLMAYVLPMGIYLGIAVAIAAYGTHRIELLHREAAQARRLGQYQLKEHLGTGGMGEVYLAEHVLLKQPCAIKLIRPERAGDSASLRRFEREVQATVRLKHWNTVQVFDYGHAADGTFYYVMEYLPGITLEQLVRQHGPLPPGRAVYLLRQACMALREAHGLGLVHRDIKPANVMNCERGGVHDVVKLLDFGLVKAIGPGRGEETLTQEGAIAGTPAYLAPEQACGKDLLDARTDIYSLGAVAYFLLTGLPPFQRDSAMELIAAHLYAPVRPLTDLRAEVPADVQAMVLRCLEKEPGKRFPDVQHLEDALAACACSNQWDEAAAALWWQRFPGAGTGLLGR